MPRPTEPHPGTRQASAASGSVGPVSGEAGAALARFAQELAESAGSADNRVVVAHSARNRFRGLISKVTRDTVMAQVEIQAGPHRFVSLLSRDATDELGLEPGMLAVATIKATNVSVDIPHSG